MTVAERLAYEARIGQLEEALSEYMKVVELTNYTLSGDLTHDYLEAYGRCLLALPEYRRAAPLAKLEGRVKG